MRAVHNAGMQFIFGLVARIVRGVLRLLLLALAIAFALGLLGVALLSVVFVLLKALLTWRRPAFVTAIVRFRQASQQFKRGGWNGPLSGSNGFPPSGEVVDVQVHEVREDGALAHNPKSERP
jgi:hypothetical protein